MTDGICSICGARNQSSASFCAACGTYLDWATEPATGPATVDPAASTGSASIARWVDGASPAPISRTPPYLASGPPTRAAAHPPVTGSLPAVDHVPAATDRPPGDPRDRRAGLLAYQPLTASAVPGHSLAGPPGANPGDAAGAWFDPPAGGPASRTGGMCHRCGRVNPTGRRYCRCGHRLQPHEPPPPLTAAMPAESGARAFDRAMRAAGKGRRPRFDKPLSGRTRAVRGVTMGALFAVALIPITPPGVGLIGRLSDTAGTVVPYEYQQVATDLAAVDPAEATVPHYVPDYAVDQADNRAWAVAWTDPPLPERCGASVAPTLVIGFVGTADVSRVIVNAGLDPADAGRAKQAAPAVIDIDFGNGTCDRLTLADGPGGQEFRVSSGPARQARVQIVAVAPAKGQGTNADQPPLAALSEIRFYLG